MKHGQKNIKSYRYTWSVQKNNFFQGNSLTFDFLFYRKHEMNFIILLKKEIIFPHTRYQC